MQTLIQNLNNNNLIFLGRIVISVICGFLIGIERENMNKNAGVRTHTIVALGSSLCVIISQYGFDTSLNYDASRVAAQIVSGIGFLGAGIIFIRQDRDISGLTTAAGIWTTAIIAMAIGTGMILLGIFCTILIVIIQWYLSKIKNKIHVTGKQIISLITLNREFDLENLIHSLDTLKIEILYLESGKINSNETDIHLVLYLPENINKWQLNKKLSELNGIKTIKL